jgi:hypothetical protein
VKIVAPWLRFRKTRGIALAEAAFMQARRELLELNRASEGDFMRVLRSLEGHLEQARTISSECAAAVEALGGSESVQAEEDLRATLERTARAQEDAGAGSRLLEESAGGIRRLEGNASRLGPSVRTFHVLGVCTRIERERLGETGAGFEGLSAEVGQLATDLGAKADGIAETCEEVRLLIEKAVTSTARMEGRRRAELPKILEASSASLEGLSWRRNQAASHSRELSEEFASISGEIGKLVGALQYHDITRQRIEHVIAALDSELLHIKQAESGGAGLAAVARLQAAQLSETLRDFQDAVERIETGLRRIAEEILKMADRASQQALGSQGESGGLKELETQFERVVEAVTEYGASSSALRGTEAGVIRALRPVSVFAGELERIGLRIQLAALNASVKAAHLGGDGAALAALADAIQGTAADSSGASGAVLGALTGVMDCAARLEKGAVEAGAFDDGGALTGELRRMVGALRRAASDSGARIGAVEKRARELAGEISSLAGGLDAASRFETAVERTIGILGQLAGAQTERAEAPHLERLRGRYTMETERALHDSVTNGAPRRDAATAPAGEGAEMFAEAASGESELGSNVELF